MAIAVVLLVCVGVRRELAAALSVGDCVALASAPITWTAVRKAHRFSLLLVLSILAAGTAYIMSLLAESSFAVEAWARRVTTLSLLAVPCAVAVFVWGARRLGTRHAALAVSQILVLAVVGIVAMVGVVMASESGTLGEDAQNRTIAQSSSSAGLLLSARPELGASWALFQNRPWGYGAGVKPRFEDLWVAKRGMAALGYNPENGYVENFMFGGRIELHSGLMDMWAAASIPGGLLLLLIAGMALAAMMRDLGRLKATPWLFFAALTVVQNVFVGPWTVLPAYLPIVLGAAVLQPPLREAAQLGIDDEPGGEPVGAAPAALTAESLPEDTTTTDQTDL